MTGIAKWNCLALQEHGALLQDLSDEDFLYTRAPVFPSPIAGHLRHDLDHYLCFLNGLDQGYIDYESRTREPDLEQSRSRAIDVIEHLTQELQVLRFDGTHPLRVRVEEDDQEEITESTVRRELDFLLSHTFHHQAIIAMMVRDLGRTLAPTYGVAPSTLRHIRKTSCAP